MGHPYKRTALAAQQALSPRAIAPLVSCRIAIVARGSQRAALHYTIYRSSFPYRLADGRRR
eukprot:8835037-Pyramimonas_sp.AAC.1